MRTAKLVILAQILLLLLFFFLIIKIYTIWIWGGLAVLVLVGFLIFTLIRSTVFVRPAPIRSANLSMRLDFLDDSGALVHITKEQKIKPYESRTSEYIDRGLAGTGKIEHFQSSIYTEHEWKKIEILPSIKVEGAELAVTTRFDPPLSNKVWTQRKFEFDCINCFLEKEESFVLRVDHPTEFSIVTFNFNKDRKPKRIRVTKIMGGYEKRLPEINPTSDRPEIFEWSIRKPDFLSEYLFVWQWIERESSSRL